MGTCFVVPSANQMWTLGQKLLRCKNDYICVSESLCCTTEINMTLLINNTPVNFFFFLVFIFKFVWLSRQWQWRNKPRWGVQCGHAGCTPWSQPCQQYLSQLTFLSREHPKIVGAKISLLQLDLKMTYPSEWHGFCWCFCFFALPLSIYVILSQLFHSSVKKKL